MTEQPLIINVRGTPRPLPRGRHVNGRVVSIADPKAKLWRQAVERELRAAIAARGGRTPLFVGPVRFRCVFTFRPPASAMHRIGTPHTLKPDASNLLKLVEDVAEACGIVKNDSQFASAPPEKWWGAQPGLTLFAESMAGERHQAWDSATAPAPDWLRR